LAAKAGISPLGTAVDIGAMLSMFACMLASITAASRVMMRVAHEGLLASALERTNRRRGTPGSAIVLSAGLMLGATVVLALHGMTGPDMNDLLGSLSVFGFLTAYALVAAALPFARRALGQHSHRVTAIAVVTVVVMILIVIFDLISASDPAHARIPYLYLAYLILGVAWYAVKRKKAAPVVR
jgi:amino acid transporter